MHWGKLKPGVRGVCWDMGLRSFRPAASQQMHAEAAWTKGTFILCQPVVSGSELLVGGLVGHEHPVVLPEKVPPRWLGL